MSKPINKVVLTVTFLGFLLILLGEVFSLFFAIRGSFSLGVGESKGQFFDSSGRTRSLGFSVSLKDFQIERYPGSQKWLLFFSQDKKLSFKIPAEAEGPQEQMPLGKDLTSFPVVSDAPIKSLRAFFEVFDKGEKGKIALTDVVEVNKSLHYQGYSFYLANLNPEDTNEVELKVIKDPAFRVVCGGFCIFCVGLLLLFYLNPYFLPKAPLPFEPGVDLPVGEVVSESV